jgi:hypothetical protein
MPKRATRISAALCIAMLVASTGYLIVLDRARRLGAERAGVDAVRPERKLVFPPDGSLGTLYVEMPVPSVQSPAPREIVGHNVKTSPNWERTALHSRLDARGTVIVPAGHRDVSLHFGRGRADLAPLAGLSEDALDALIFLNSRIEGAQLAHIAHLTGLKALQFTGPPIEGEGVVHLASLKGVEILIMPNGSALSDSELNAIAQMESLQVLVLLGVDVSRSSLERLMRSRPYTRVHHEYTQIGGLPEHGRDLSPASPSRPIG